MPSYQCLHYHEVDSTNHVAQERIRQGIAQEGDLIRSDCQCAGRGQGDHRWESEAGKNLLFSLILQPHHVAPARQFLLNQMVTLALCDSLALDGIQIKWPNDIYVGTKKLCGILIEHRICGATLDWSVVGIGLNVNQTQFSAELPNPTSLFLETGHAQILDSIQQQFVEAFERRYRHPQPKRLNDDYHDRLYLRGQWFDFEREAGRFRGRIRGVDSMGQLEVETPEGLERFGLHQICYRPPADSQSV